VRTGRHIALRRGKSEFRRARGSCNLCHSALTDSRAGWTPFAAYTTAMNFWTSTAMLSVWPRRRSFRLASPAASGRFSSSADMFRGACRNPARHNLVTSGLDISSDIRAISIARHVSGLGPGISFMHRRVAHGNDGPPDSRTHPCGRGTAAYRVRRRRIGPTVPDIPNDSRAVLGFSVNVSIPPVAHFCRGVRRRHAAASFDSAGETTGGGRDSQSLPGPDW